MEEKIVKECFLVFMYLKDQKYWYAEIDSIEENDGANGVSKKLPCKLYGKPLFKSNICGGIYPVKFNQDGFVIYSKNKFPADMWKCNDDRKEWSALNRSATIEKLVQKELKVNAIEEAMLPIQQAYQRANWQQKNLILADVIRMITRR